MTPFGSFLTLGLLALAAQHVHGADVEVNACDDLALITDALEGEDVTATVVNDLTCDSWTTVVVPEERALTVQGVDSSTRVKFTNIRFVVEEREYDAEMDLTFSTDVKFFTSVDADSSLGIQVGHWELGDLFKWKRFGVGRAHHLSRWVSILCWKA